MAAKKKETKKSKGPIYGILGLIAVVAIAAVAIIAPKGKDGHEGHDHGAETAAMEQTTEQAAANDNAAQENAEIAPASNADSAKNDAPAAADVDLGEGLKVEPGNPVVAKVDGKEITRVDVYRFIQTMPANVQQLPAAAVYPMALEQVVNTRLVQNQADSSEVSASDKYKLELEMAKQQLARNLYLEDQVAAKISDSKLNKAYKEFMKTVPEVKERRARHILLETEDKAKAVIDQLNKGGDFEGLAKELSTGPTAPKGGDLGYFADGEMVPEFSKQVFSMKKGEVTSAPVKTQFGYHVIKLEDIRDRPKPTMEQVKPALEADIRREILTELLQDWRKNAKIEQFDINGNPLKEGANALGIVPPKTATN